MTTYNVQDLNDNLDYLAETKKQLKTAIQNKGVAVSDSDTFRSYVNKVSQIETGINTDDANVTSSDIRKNKVAYAKGNRIVGTMQDTTTYNIEPNIDTTKTNTVNMYIENVSTPSIKESLLLNSPNSYDLQKCKAYGGKTVNKITATQECILHGTCLAIIMHRFDITVEDSDWKFITKSDSIEGNGTTQWVSIYYKKDTKETEDIIISTGSNADRLECQMIVFDYLCDFEVQVNTVYNLNNGSFSLGSSQNKNDVYIASVVMAVSDSGDSGIQLWDARCTQIPFIYNNDKRLVSYICYETWNRVPYFNDNDASRYDTIIMKLRPTNNAYVLKSENLKSGVKLLDVTGTFTSDATATEEDIISGKTAYVNGKLVEGEIIPMYSDEDVEVGIKNYPNTGGNYYLLDYLPEKRIGLIQLQSFAFDEVSSQNLIIAKINDDSSYTTLYTITLSDLKSMVSPTYPANQIYTARISRTPIKDNIYNIVMQGLNLEYDYKSFYLIRFDFDTNTLYSDSSISRCLYTYMYDIWGAQSNTGYQIFASNINPNIFMMTPVYPRTEGGIKGYQYLGKLTVENTSMSFTTTNTLTNPSDVLRWLIYDDTNTYCAINLSNGTCEGVYQTSDLVKKFTPSGITCFVTVNNVTYMMYNKRLYSMTNELKSDWSSSISSNYIYSIGYKNILFLFYSSTLDVYVISDDLTIRKYNSYNISISQSYDANSYQRLVQVPYYAENYIVFGNLGTNITQSIVRFDNLLSLTRNNLTYYNGAVTKDLQSNDVLEGKQFIGISDIETGTMSNNGNLFIFPSSTEDKIIPAGYTSGGKVYQVNSNIDSNIRAENIKAGVTILGIEGNLETSSIDNYQELENQSNEILNGFSQYSILDYLESDGNQYIDTGIYPSSNIKVELTVSFIYPDYTNETYTSIAFMGAWNNSKGLIFGYSSIMGGVGYAMAADAGWKYPSTQILGDSEFHTFVYDAINDISSVDDVTFTHKDISTYNYNMYLFKANQFTNDSINSENLAYDMQIRIKSCKIYDSTNTLIRDFIPVIRVEDDKACMYDKVNKMFYDNLGTGDFVAGSILTENKTLQENLDIIEYEKETKILPENIKAGVTIFGITGTYTGDN